MKELEQLVIEIVKKSKQVFTGILFDEKLDLKNLIEELDKKYSVSLRSASNSVGNNPVGQLGSNEELISKIESLIGDMDAVIVDDYYGNEEAVIIGKAKVVKEIRKLFQTYRNTNSRPVNTKVDTLVNEEELESEIKDLINEFDCSDMYSKDQMLRYSKKIIKLFRTHQTSSPSLVNKSDEELVNNNKTMAKIEDMALEFGQDLLNEECIHKVEKSEAFKKFKERMYK